MSCLNRIIFTSFLHFEECQLHNKNDYPMKDSRLKGQRMDKGVIFSPLRQSSFLRYQQN